MKKVNFSPKEFLRNRRPEKFSDSVVIEKNILDRSVLEHHIATLNKRSQELAFETYSKLICEKEICPNLLEQTGPVAGGDGKVDTQTFPVSEQNQLMWFEGINESSHKERWGFAVSTRVDWKVKCREDIRKIKGTNRGYVKAFFITNQYAKSDQRHAIEDSLRTETKIDVRILDISWLLDRTFKNGYEYIAIETLSLNAAQTSVQKQGPNDYRKSCDLDNLLERINKDINPQIIETHQVDMFLDAAILSKELEKGTLETQGLFDRAVRIANKFGTNQQKFSAYYQYAWASHWWFEDFSLFEINFENAYKCIIDSTNSCKWENFVTLINVFHGHTEITGITSSIDFDLIKNKTIEQLKLIAYDESRPSNSLKARTSLELLDLVAINDQNDARSILNNLLGIAKECERLVGYSFDSLFDLISEMDLAFGDMEEYETLLDYLTEQSSIRYGEVQGSLVLLNRGIKRLSADKPNQAIKLVGKALHGLYKHESRKEIVVALNVLSWSYSKIGLMWASRGTLLLAASLITDEFWRNDEITPEQAKSYFRLAWTEIQLGRLSHALVWFELCLVINANLENSILEETELVNFDAYISHCILRSGLTTIKNLEKIPDLFDKFGLFNSRAMLLYCLGYEDLVAEEYEIDLNKDTVDYFVKVRDYDFGVITNDINIFTGRWNEITSTVLGCNIKVTFPLRSPFVELAESVLSVIEGFCATGIVDKVISIESKLQIDIIADDEDDVVISHDIDDVDGNIVIEVVCSNITQEMMNIEGQKIIQEWLHDFIIDVYSKITITNDFEKNIESLVGNDNALSRSISFGACFTTLHNTLGKDAIKNISSLTEGKDIKSYTLTRDINWDSLFPIKPLTKSSLLEPTSETKGVSKPSLNYEKLSHKDISTSGLIKPRLWDEAKWSGTGFVTAANMIPLLSLTFENKQAANYIFKNLLNELGTKDHSKRLRISIIRKISSHEPFNYRVCLTENIMSGESKIVTTIYRLNTMTPNTDKNLNIFLNAYETAGRFNFTYGVLNNGKLSASFNKKFVIEITDLIVMDAWQIGLNDMECMAINKDDTPIIPENIKEPPVLDVLNKLHNSPKT
ncbi:MAG: tetratricopeptide repeat protein [Pseudomonadota bacterium]